MPEFLTGVNGGRVTVYLESEVVASGRPRQSFTESPQWLMSARGWTEPRFVYKANPMEPWETFWENRFGRPDPEPVKMGFYELFTASRGPLIGAEVRDAERRAGVMIDDHTAVSAYNTKLEHDQELFGGILTLDELADSLDATGAARLRQVHDWVTGIMNVPPQYFRFTTRKVISEDVVMIEGIRHVVSNVVGDADTVGVAFPGPHGLKRDVFNLTQFLGSGPNPAAEGRRAMQLPGRDRAFRIIGVEALSTYLFSPVLALTSIQVSQLQEGRSVTMPRSPVVPPELGAWA